MVLGQHKCRHCGRLNPILSFRFVDADVSLSACEQCDWLRAKTPKELR